jgi:hypothetical protein
MTSGVKRVYKGRFHTKDSTRKALLDVMGGFHHNRERYNWMWNAARKSVMLTKKPPKDKDGKTIKKYNTAGNLILKTARLSRTHGYKVLLSGASAEAYRIMSAESQLLRRKVDPESAYCPAMPTISDGALLNLEQICVAICQTYFGRAVGLKNTVPLSEKEKENKVEKKVTGKMQDLACATVNEKIFGATSLGPGVLRMVPIVKKPAMGEAKMNALKKRRADAKEKKAMRRRKKLGLPEPEEEPTSADA